MKLIHLYIPCAFLLFVNLTGCQKSAPSGQEMTFDVQMAGASEENPETKADPTAGQYTATDLNSLGQFQVTAYDGTTKDIDNRTVKRFSSGVWGFEDSPTIWVEGKTRTFWASANLPTSGITVTPNSSSQATISVTEISSDVAKQWDPLVGYYQGTGNAGKATITFYHPMTAVKFKTGKLEDGTHSVTGITNVKIKGVYKSGTATINGATPITYSWTPGSTMIDVTGPFTGTGSAAESAKPFLLIPQNLGTKNVTLELTVSTSSGTKTMNAKLTSGEWQAGKTNIYTLDYINNEFGENIVVTLTDWGTEKSTSEKDYFDAIYN